MRRFAGRFARWGAVSAMAVGTTFQIGSCTIDENGVMNLFADTLGLVDLKTQLFEASPFADLFEDFGGFADRGSFGRGEDQ
jgi:hypothetical protein